MWLISTCIGTHLFIYDGIFEIAKKLKLIHNHIRTNIVQCLALHNHICLYKAIQLSI